MKTKNESLEDREDALRKERVAIQNPNKGDIFMNSFGTAVMLVSGDRTLTVMIDGKSNVYYCNKTWKDVIEDPYMKKAATINTFLEALKL